MNATTTAEVRQRFLLDLDTLLQTGAPAAGWAWENPPAGLSLNPSTGQISGSHLLVSRPFFFLPSSSGAWPSLTSSRWIHAPICPNSRLIFRHLH